MVRFSAENASKSIWRPGSAQICWEAYSPPQIPELDLKGKRPPGRGWEEGRSGGERREGRRGWWVPYQHFFFPTSSLGYSHQWSSNFAGESLLASCYRVHSGSYIQAGGRNSQPNLALVFITIIFLPCDFYLSSFSFPRLISAAVDWMSTILPHMVWP